MATHPTCVFVMPVPGMRLFSQVIPFVYSHLVSIGSFLYLIGLAIHKASRYRPEATYLSGLVLPGGHISILNSSYASSVYSLLDLAAASPATDIALFEWSCDMCE